MSTNNDPDETAVLDLNVAKRRIVELFAADGIVDANERAAIAMLEAPVSLLSRRFRVRKSFESIMRNGINRYTRTNATDVGVAFVHADGEMRNVIEFTDAKKRRQESTPDSAA